MQFYVPFSNKFDHEFQNFQYIFNVLSYIS